MLSKNKFCRLAIILALFCLIGTSVHSQEQTVDAQTKDQLKVIMAYLLETLYVSPEIGKQLSKQLQAKFESGAYKEITTPTKLAQALTRDLRELSKDLHLSVRYASGPGESGTILTPQGWERTKSSIFPTAPREPSTPQAGTAPADVQGPQRRAPELDARMANQLLESNYHFRETKYLSGNIGYLKLDGFAPGQAARDAAAKTMALLANSEGMIIDMRRCPGGTQEMVNFLASYFFDREPRLLLTSYFRPTGETVQNKTIADIPGKRMLDTDLYLLVSANTVSACEAFAYILQQYGRAKVIGERTAGAGNHNFFVPVGLGYSFSVSIGSVVHPRSGKGWQGEGVQPDTVVTPDDALETAHREALQKLISRTTDQNRKKELVTALQDVARNVESPKAVAPAPVAQASVATQKQSFSGVWVLDKAKSEGLPPSVDQTVTIAQDGDKVEVATKTTSERGEQNSKSTYVLDGKEAEAALSGPMPGNIVKGKQTARWSADGKGFESIDEGTFETPNGPATIKTSRKFRLSPDGATLVIEISREGPITQKSRRVFAKAANAGGAPAGSEASRKMSDAEIVKETETYLEQASAEDTFSGAVLIAKDGKPILKKAYGSANKSSNTANNVDTKFNLGSIDKSFTAVAIAQLVQQGKLSFNDPISKYLPDYPNKAVAAKVTIHQLLTHTSGMGMYFNEEFMKRRASLKTLSDLLPLFVNDTLDFEPGEKMQYSNAGYVVLGLVIEKLSGQNYFDYVRQHIFEPAGMKNTASYELDQKVPNLAIGYTNMGLTGRPEPGPRKDSTPHLTGRGSSAGGGYSTLDDLLKFGQALIDHKLLNKQYTDIVLSNKMPTGQPPAGYGFFSVQVNGALAIGNNGGGPGTNSTFSVYPELGYTVVVLSNYDPPSASKVNGKIRDLLLTNSAPIAGAPPASSAAQLSQSEQEVRKLEREWLDAYEQHDAVAMDRVLADDFKLTQSSGATQTKADIMAALKVARDTSRPEPKFSTEDVRSRVEGDTVILTGRFIQRMERDGQTRTMEAQYTDTYMKRQGRWQVVASLMTRIPSQ